MVECNVSAIVWLNRVVGKAEGKWLFIRPRGSRGEEGYERAPNWLTVSVRGANWEPGRATRMGERRIGQYRAGSKGTGLAAGVGFLGNQSLNIY